MMINIFQDRRPQWSMPRYVYKDKSSWYLFLLLKDSSSNETKLDFSNQDTLASLEEIQQQTIHFNKSS